MGERKVLNKYFPPDFDPSALPKGKRAANDERKVRMMLPMSVRCNTCGNFMYKGTKFNTRMETVAGELYLGLKIFRFYYRCTNCAAEFCMKTDPKTTDYIMEEGATRNYEPWRDQEVSKAEAVRTREEEEMGNAMKALENRTLDSKREMDIMAALDEVQTLNARHNKVSTEDALAALQREAARHQQSLEEEELQDLAEFHLLRREKLHQEAATAGPATSSSSSDGDDDRLGGKGATRGAAGAKRARVGQGPSGSGLGLVLGGEVFDEGADAGQSKAQHKAAGGAESSKADPDRAAPDATAAAGSGQAVAAAGPGQPAAGKPAAAAAAPVKPAFLPKFVAKPKAAPAKQQVASKDKDELDGQHREDGGSDGAGLTGLLGYDSGDSQ